MNSLYYSTYCPHSRQILDFLRRNNLMNKLNFFCVDNRIQDKKTGIIYLIAEDKKTKNMLPPNIHEVPALLLIREQYRVILGKEIIRYFQPQTNNVFNEVKITEPLALTNDSQMYSSYSGSDSVNKLGDIETPPDDFVPNKIGLNVTIESIAKQRTLDLENIVL